MGFYVEKIDIRGLSKDDLQKIASCVRAEYLDSGGERLKEFVYRLYGIIDDPDCHIAPRAKT